MSQSTGAAPASSAAGQMPRAGSVTSRTHRRPDPLPSRLVMGIGALAALSVMGAGMGRLPETTADVPAGDPSEPTLTATLSGEMGARATRVERPVRYIRLKPGEQAPRGARVIREKAPAPRVVVRWVSAPSSSATTSRAPVARTRQSGG